MTTVYVIMEHGRYEVEDVVDEKFFYSYQEAAAYREAHVSWVDFRVCEMECEVDAGAVEPPLSYEAQKEANAIWGAEQSWLGALIRSSERVEESDE